MPRPPASIRRPTSIPTGGTAPASPSGSSQGDDNNCSSCEPLDPTSPSFNPYTLAQDYRDIMELETWRLSTSIRIRFFLDWRKKNCNFYLSPIGNALRKQGNVAAHDGNCLFDAVMLQVHEQCNWSGVDGTPSQDFQSIYGIAYTQVLQHRNNVDLIEATNMLGTIITTFGLRSSNSEVKDLVRKVSNIREWALSNNSTNTAQQRQLMEEIRELHNKLSR